VVSRTTNPRKLMRSPTRMVAKRAQARALPNVIRVEVGKPRERPLAQGSAPSVKAATRCAHTYRPLSLPAHRPADAARKDPGGTYRRCRPTYTSSLDLSIIWPASSVASRKWAGCMRPKRIGWTEALWAGQAVAGSARPLYDDIGARRLTRFPNSRRSLASVRPPSAHGKLVALGLLRAPSLQ